MLWHNEYAGKPRRKFWPNIYVMLNEARRAEQLVIGQRNESSRNCAVATRTFNTQSAIFHGFTWPEMTPLHMMPARDIGYELATISEVFDGHASSEDAHFSTERLYPGGRLSSDKRSIGHMQYSSCSSLTTG